MTDTAARWAARGMRALRSRVRLRTRLRQLRAAWRARFPRRLPRWRPPELPERSAPVGAASAGAAGAASATAVVDGVVRVDAAGANPRGRDRHGPSLAAGRLRLVADAAGTPGWEVARPGDGVPVVAGRVGQPLTDRHARVLRELAVVHAEPPGDTAGTAGAGDTAGTAGAGDTAGGDAASWGQVVAQLAMTGVVVHTPRPAPPAGGLAPELASILAEPLPDGSPAGDAFDWERRSVRQRRAALQGHAAGLGRPAVSALLVTKRPALVPAQVAALAAQTYPELELVVAVHGAEPPADLPAGDRPVTALTVPADRTLGEALDAAAAAASGTVVTKVDDDDRYGQEHVWDLVLARHYAGTTVVGRGAEFVHLTQRDLTVRRRMGTEMGTDTVAGGTIALDRAALAEVGGWPAVPQSVDRQLLDRVIAAGGSVYRTHAVGFVYTRHGDGHTWDPGVEYFLRDPVRTWSGLPPYPEFGTDAQTAQPGSAGQA